MVRQQRRKYSVNGQGRALEGEENNKRRGLGKPEFYGAWEEMHMKLRMMGMGEKFGHLMEIRKWAIEEEILI